MQKNMDIGGAPYVPWGTPRDIIPSRYRRKNAWKRLLAGAFTAVMLVGLLPAAALAAPDGEGLCPHHREHTETCGYLAPGEESPCGHIHEAGCYSDGVLPAEGEEAAADACAHTHDETCGYAPATAGMPCGFDCSICPVQVLIDALPTADELAAMSSEEQQAVYEDLQTAYEAYNALTDEQKAEVIGAEIFDSLFEVFNSMVNTLADGSITEAGITITYSNGGNAAYTEGSGFQITANGDYVISGTWNGSITGAWTNDRKSVITVSGNITANITIQSLTIDVSGTAYVGAFGIKDGATVNLTLSGENSLKSGRGASGLGVLAGTKLTIEGDGSLEAACSTEGYGAGIGERDGGGDCGDITINSGTIVAIGGRSCAGIGNRALGTQPQATSTITINGGTVTAIGGDWAAGIGGNASCHGSKVIISGGTVTAIGGSGAPGIGAGADMYSQSPTQGTFSTGKNGDAIIIAQGGIGDTSNQSNWSGLVIGGNSGIYGGDSFTLDEDLEIPSGNTLNIEGGKTLIVNNGVTLTNNGSITGSGTLDGKGDLEGSGTVADTIDNKLRKDSVVAVSIKPSEAVYGSTVTITAKISRAENALTRAAAQNKVDFYLGTADDRTLLDSVDVSDNTATLQVSLNDEKWTAGQHTITAEYGGSMGLEPYTSTTTLNVTKAGQSTPASPVLNKATTNSITLNETTGGQTGAEYGYTTAGGQASDVSNWQAGTTFEGLDPGTGYTFYARYPGNEYYEPSDVSEGETIYTLPEITTANLDDGYVGVSYIDTLTAKAADGTDVTWSLVGDTSLPAGLSLDTDGTIKGKPTAPTDTPVTFTVQATINGDVSNTKELSITVHKGTPDFGTLAVSGYSGEGGAFVYGDTITILGTIQASSTAPITNALTTPAADEAALFLGDKQLTEPVAVAEDGGFTIQYDTSDKGITPGAAPQTLTVKYGGSDNLTTGERTTTITLLPRPLTAAITGTTTKVYDGTTNAPEDLSITLSGVVGEDDVTATATFAYDGKDVGDQTITASNITLDGADQGNYKLSSTTATANGSITESGSTLTATAEKTDLTYGDTLSITVTPSTTGQAPAANAIRADGKRGVELFYEGASLAAADAPNDKGEYVLTYDTAGKAIPIGDHISLTVQFYGDGNMAASGTTATISLAPKPVTATVDTPVSKAYDQGKEIPLTLSLAEGSLENTGDAVMVTATGTFDSADVGEHKTVTVGALTVEGADAGRYSVTASQDSVTGSITEAKIEGTLTITGDAKVDCTLTAVYTPKSGETVSYQWSVDGAEISEATEETYIVRAEDVGKKITVTATAADTNHTGSVTCEAVTAGKGDQEAPPQPKVKSVSTYSIEMEPMEANPDTGAAVEFSIDGGEHWQTKTVFDGLSSSSTYEIIARYGENDAYDASPASEPVKATTHSSSDSTFPPTVKPGEGGEVIVKPNSPHKGDKVTIIPEPEKDHEVDEVIVTGKDGDQVKVTDNGDGTWSFTQPNGKVTIEVTFREIGPEPLPFTDVPPDAWYIDGVRYVYTHHIMSGTSPTTFSPSTPVSRGMIVQVLYNLAGQPEVEGGHDFSDVPAGYWSEKAIIWAVQNGVVGGYGDGTFGPDDTLTREQLAVVLFNYANAMGYDTTARRDLSGFDDVTHAQDWARTALEWAYAEHLITGTSDTTMSPTGRSSRAQIAVIMMRFCENIAE